MAREKEELYEIVPVEPYSQIEKRSGQLEKEIQEIRDALRSTVGLAKVEASAGPIITQMLDMLQSSQRMVEEVANSNKLIAEKVQAALDKMNENNSVLSGKISKILDYFAQASESMGEEESSGDDVSKSIKELSRVMEKIAEQNEQILETLGSIEKSMKRTAVRAVPAKPAYPSMPLKPRVAIPSGAPPLPEGEDLPPPPFPP